MSRFRLPCLVLLLASLTQPLVLQGQADAGPAADAAWDRLATLAAPRTARDAPERTPSDWTAIADAAKKFQTDFRNHPKARTAARIELTARIMAEDGSRELSAEVATAVAAYLGDRGNDVRDRLQLTSDFNRAKIRRAKPATYEDMMQIRAGQARELMGNFSDQPDGFGYMLSLARLASPAQGGPLAEELLASQTTPERFKPMARRVAERRALLNHPLQLNGAEAALAAASGKTLVIYSWRTADGGFLAILKRMRSIPDVAFIGINLDVNKATAEVAARDLPGIQFYDGGGLEGPLARQLQLVLNTSVYLVDGQGILRDLDAHRSPHDQLLGFLAASKGGAR